MAQLSLYLPDEVADRLKDAAKKAGKSLSAYVADLAARDLAPSRWPRGFSRLYGAWKGPFPAPDDPPPDEVEPLS